MTDTQNPANAPGSFSVRKLIEEVNSLHINDVVDQEKFDNLSESIKELCKYTKNLDWEVIYLDFAGMLHSFWCLVTRVLHEDIRFFYHAVSEFIAVLRCISMRRYLVVDSVVQCLSCPVLQWVTRSDVPVILRYGMLNIWNDCLVTATHAAKRNVSMSLKSVLLNLLKQLLSCGNYGFQSAILEAFFHYIGIKADRTEFTDHFKALNRIERAFLSTRFDEFCRDSRMFINLLNLSLGENRTVLSLSAERVRIRDLDGVKAMSNFWVDFNLGTKSITLEKDITINVHGQSHNNEDLSYVKINRQTLSKAIVNSRKVGNGFVLVLCLTKPVKREVSLLFDDSYQPSDLRSVMLKMFSKLPQVNISDSSQSNIGCTQTTPKALNTSFQFRERNTPSQGSTLQFLSQDILNSSFFSRRHSRQDFENNFASPESQKKSCNKNFNNKPHYLFPESSAFNSAADCNDSLTHPENRASNCALSGVDATPRAKGKDDDFYTQTSVIFEETQNVERNAFQSLEHTQNTEHTKHDQTMEYESRNSEQACKKIHETSEISTPIKFIERHQSAISTCNGKTDKQQQVLHDESFRDIEMSVSQDNNEASELKSYDATSVTRKQVKKRNKRYLTDFVTDSQNSVTNKVDFHENMNADSEIDTETRKENDLSCNDLHQINRNKRRKSYEEDEQKIKILQRISRSQCEITSDIAMCNYENNMTSNNKTKLLDKAIGNYTFPPYKCSLHIKKSMKDLLDDTQNCVFSEKTTKEKFISKMDGNSTVILKETVNEASIMNGKEYLDPKSSIENEVQKTQHDFENKSVTNNEEIFITDSLVTEKNICNKNVIEADKVDYRYRTECNETLKSVDLVFLDISEYNESEVNTTFSTCKTVPPVINDGYNQADRSVSPRKEIVSKHIMGSPHRRMDSVRNRSFICSPQSSLACSPQKLADIGGSQKQQIAEVLKMCKERLSQQLPAEREVDVFSVISEKTNISEKSHENIYNFKNKIELDGHFSDDDCIICPRSNKSSQLRKKRKLFSVSRNSDFDLPPNNSVENLYSTVDNLSLFENDSLFISFDMGKNLSSAHLNDTQSKENRICQESVLENSKTHKGKKNVIKNLDDVPLLQRLELMTEKTTSNEKCRNVLTCINIKSILDQENQHKAKPNKTELTGRNSNRWKEKYKKLELGKTKNNNRKGKNTTISKDKSVYSDIEYDDFSWSNFSPVRTVRHSTPYKAGHKSDSVIRSCLRKSDALRTKQTPKHKIKQTEFSKRRTFVKRKGRLMSKETSYQKVVDTSSSGEEFPPLIIETEKKSFVSWDNVLDSSFESDKLSLVSQGKEKSDNLSVKGKDHSSVMEHENVEDASVKTVENILSRPSAEQSSNGKNNKSDNSVKRTNYDESNSKNVNSVMNCISECRILTTEHNGLLSDSLDQVKNDVKHSNSNVVQKCHSHSHKLTSLPAEVTQKSGELVHVARNKNMFSKSDNEEDALLMIHFERSTDNHDSHFEGTIAENHSIHSKTLRYKKSQEIVKCDISRVSVQNSPTGSLSQNSEASVSSVDNIKGKSFCKKKHNVTIIDSDSDDENNDNVANTNVLGFQKNKPTSTIVSEEGNGYAKQTPNFQDIIQKRILSNSDSDSSNKSSERSRSRILPLTDQDLDILAKSLNEYSDDEIVPCTQNDNKLGKQLSFSKKVMHIKANNSTLRNRKQSQISVSPCNDAFDNKLSKKTNCSCIKSKNLLKSVSNKTKNDDSKLCSCGSVTEDSSDSCFEGNTKLSVPVNSVNTKPTFRTRTVELETTPPDITRDCFVRLSPLKMEKCSSV